MHNFSKHSLNRLEERKFTKESINRSSTKKLMLLFIRARGMKTLTSISGNAEASIYSLFIAVKLQLSMHHITIKPIYPA